MRYFYLSNTCKHVANTKMRPRLQVSNIDIISCLLTYVQTAYKYIYVVYLLLYDRVIFAIYLHRLVCISGLL